MNGILTYEYLQAILARLSVLAGQTDTQCRCGDSSYDFLRKIVHVARLDAGLPDLPTYEFRPGDSDFNLSFKALVILTSDNCRCGDSIYNLWCRILDSVSEGAGLPHISRFSCSPGDSLNDLLRKLLDVLDQEVVPPVPPSPCCLPIGDYGSVIDPVLLACDWGSVIEPVECADDWGFVV